jgi:hypothetical protein
MIESWVGAMSSLLPRAINESGHRFTFMTRDLHHYLRAAPSHPHPLLAADNVLTAETNDVTALLDHVARLHEVLRFDGVISSCDYYLPAVARVAAHLGLPGPDPLAVERACRKDLTRTALRAAGVPGPRFALADGWPALAKAAAELGYPLVVKPVDLCAGMHVRKVADESELREAFEDIRRELPDPRELRDDFAEELADELGKRAIRLPVAGAFHSPSMAPAVAPFRQALDEKDFREPDFTVFSCATAKPFEDPRDELARALIRPVRWRETFTAMHEAGAKNFIEVGPGMVLARLAKRIVAGTKVETPSSKREVHA